MTPYKFPGTVSIHLKRIVDFITLVLSSHLRLSHLGNNPTNDAITKAPRRYIFRGVYTSP